MTSTTRSAERSPEERIVALRIQVQTALLIGGVPREETQALLEELKMLQSTLRRVRPECLHAEAAAA